MTASESPIDREAFLGAVSPTFALPANVIKPRDKPRASGLADCARSQAYYMTGLAQGAPNPAQSDLPLTQEQGRMFEDITAAVIANTPTKSGRPVEVHMRQVCIGHEICTPDSIQGPLDFFVTGHPDGEFWHPDVLVSDPSLAQADQGDPNLRRLDDGLIWGFEHKHLGRYGYTKAPKAGVFDAAYPEYLLQGLLYGAALGWDAVLVFVTSQDASAVRGDATANLRAKKPARRWATEGFWHAKVMLHTFSIADYKPLYDMAKTRAGWLAKWKAEDGDPTHVMREYSPENNVKDVWMVDEDGQPTKTSGPDFPCSYCPYLARCLEDGQSGVAAPQLPFTGISEGEQD